MNNLYETNKKFVFESTLTSFIDFSTHSRIRYQMAKSPYGAWTGIWNEWLNEGRGAYKYMLGGTASIKTFSDKSQFKGDDIAFRLARAFV